MLKLTFLLFLKNFFTKNNSKCILKGLKVLKKQFNFLIFL